MSEPAQWKCPDGKCAPTDRAPLDVTASHDGVPTVICNGECGNIYPRSAVRLVDAPAPVGATTSRGVRGLSVRFCLESVSAFVTLVLAIVTVFVPDWIEVVFRVDPDHGDGSLERMVVLALAVISVVLTVAARNEWRRLRLAA